MQNETTPTVPKLISRTTPTENEFPIYLKNKESGAVYKLLSPKNYVSASMINGSIDIRVRNYDKVVTNVFDEYMKGSPEYIITNADDFHDVLHKIVNGLVSVSTQ